MEAPHGNWPPKDEADPLQDPWQPAQERVLLYLKACGVPSRTSLEICSVVLQQVEAQRPVGEEEEKGDSPVSACMSAVWERMDGEPGGPWTHRALPQLPITPAINPGSMVPAGKRISGLHGVPGRSGGPPKRRLWLRRSALLGLVVIHLLIFYFVF